MYLVKEVAFLCIYTFDVFINFMYTDEIIKIVVVVVFANTVDACIIESVKCVLGNCRRRD